MDIIDKLISDLGYSREFWEHYAGCNHCSIQLEYEGYVETCQIINPRSPMQKLLPGSLGATVLEVYGPLIQKYVEDTVKFAEILDKPGKLNQEKGGE